MTTAGIEKPSWTRDVTVMLALWFVGLLVGSGALFVFADAIQTV